MISKAKMIQKQAKMLKKSFLFNKCYLKLIISFFLFIFFYFIYFLFVFKKNSIFVPPLGFAFRKFPNFTVRSLKSILQ